MTEPTARPRDPRRGLRAIAAVLLTLESLSVALALAVTRSQGHGAPAIAALLALTLALLVAAGALRRRFGRSLATLLQPLVILAGVAAWPLYVLGALFGGLWGAVLWMESGLPAAEPPPAGR